MLHLTQPAVSHQLAELERETRTALLNRRPRGVSLTPAGKAGLVNFLDGKGVLRQLVASDPPAARALSQDSQVNLQPGVRLWGAKVVGQPKALSGGEYASLVVPMLHFSRVTLNSNL